MSSHPGGNSNRNKDSKGRESSIGSKGPSRGSGGPAPSPSSPALGPPSSIPEYLSFIFRIESLRPNYQAQTRRHTSTGAWAPPNQANAYTLVSSTVWRWQGGRVSAVRSNDPVLRATFSRYDAATLFSQYPDTPHLLVVPFDARTRNVSNYGPGWLPITFDHEPTNRIVGAREYYSSISALGSEARIAAPGQGFWIPQLLPDWYNYRAAPYSEPRTHAGLIGNLPILLALAVFSAPATNVVDAMNSLQPGAWYRHRHPYPSGHTIGDRGMVITVFFDPLNPEYSTRAQLDRLQDGELGPFYGRVPANGPSNTVSSGPSAPSPSPFAGPSRGSTVGAYRQP